MLFSGVASVYSMPRRDDIQITEEQEERFIKCVLTNQPFTEVVKLGDLTVVFTTPSAEEYPILSQADEDVFADWLFYSNIKSIRKGEEVLYTKSTDVSLDERGARIRKIFGDSVAFPVLVGHWYRFRETYNQLYRKAMDPNFFVPKSVTSGGSA